MLSASVQTRERDLINDRSSTPQIPISPGFGTLATRAISSKSKVRFPFRGSTMACSESRAPTQHTSSSAGAFENIIFSKTSNSSALYSVFIDAGDDAPSQRNLTRVSASVATKGRQND